jgi:hypothetical protein
MSRIYTVHHLILSCRVCPLCGVTDAGHFCRRTGAPIADLAAILSSCPLPLAPTGVSERSAPTGVSERSAPAGVSERSEASAPPPSTPEPRDEPAPF